MGNLKLNDISARRESGGQKRQGKSEGCDDVQVSAAQEREGGASHDVAQHETASPQKQPSLQNDSPNASLMPGPATDGMPSQLAELWRPLYTEVVWLHARWKIFRQLYDGKRSVDILNRAAPGFFIILQRIMADEIQLSISKLADPFTVGKRKNLTLETLLHEIRRGGNCELANALLDDVEALRANDNVRHRRNKYIAHHDLETLLKGEATAAPSASYGQIKEAMETIRRFMNRIEKHFRNTTTAFNAFSFRGDGADAVVSRLSSGLLYEELVQNGIIPRKR